MSLRDQLKSRSKLEKLDIGVDGLCIKTMSGLDRSTFMEMSETFDSDDLGDSLARKNAVLIVLSLAGEDGAMIYTLDDIDEIISLEAYDIDEIVKAALRINKLTTEEQEGQEKN